MKLPIDFERSFLSIATDKNFGSNTEDRLTQIVVATFEHSMEFRKIFMKLLDIKIDVAVLTLATRSANNDNKRPDLVVYNKNKSIAVIECKTLSKLHRRQLRSYHNDASNRYILTIYPEAQELVPDGWRRKSWGELLHLIRETTVRDKAQQWMIQQVGKYLSELGVIEMSSLTQKDLDKIALFFRGVRFKKYPNIKASSAIKRLPILEHILVEGFNIVSAEIDAKKYFGKKLRPNMWLSYEWDSIEQQGWPYLQIGLIGLQIVNHREIKQLSIALIMKKETAKATMYATLWRKKSKGEKGVGPIREIKSIPIDIRKSIGPRELALQIRKKILSKLKD